MALVNPFITNKFVAYLDPKTLTKTVTTVSLVVWLIDEVTGKRPESHITVRLKGVANQPIQSLSGYWCFMDLKKATYTIVAESAPVNNDWYFDVEQQIDLSTLDVRHPVVELILKPKPSYPFPSHLTLIQGVIQEKVGDSKPPLPGSPVYRLFKFTIEEEDGIIPLLVTQLQSEIFSTELSERFKQLAIPIEGNTTVTAEADTRWKIEADGNHQQCVVELVNDHLDVYCHKLAADLGATTKSDRNGEYVLYIKKFVKDKDSNKMSVLIGAESGESRLRQKIDISVEGQRLIKQHFEFDSR